jgi:hypothetical protein
LDGGAEKTTSDDGWMDNMDGLDWGWALSGGLTCALSQAVEAKLVCDLGGVHGVLIEE